jgi:hypothetical protein
MATHIQKAGSDIGTWGPVHNDYHRTTNGGYEWFDIQANANNPPTVKRYSRFQFWATDNSYSIPDVATGNNNYPQATTPTYLNSQAIFEDGTDVTFTWEGTVRGEVLPAQSDGTWYVICKGCLDTDASTKGQGVYTVSKTETPTYSGQKGGFYSAGGFRVLASFVSTSGTVSAVTILNYPNLPNVDGTANQVLKTNGTGTVSFADPYALGKFTGGGISFATPNIVLAPYVIEAAGKLYSSAAAVNVVDLTGQVANTWYAVVLREDNGAISAVTLGAGWDNLTISGNALNMYSIYNAAYDYCRDSRSGVFYRVLGVYLTNAVPNGISRNRIFNFRNIPKDFCFYESTTAQSIATETAFTTAHFEICVVDVNSCVTVGATPAWSYTPKKNHVVTISSAWIFTATNDWSQNERGVIAVADGTTIMHRMQTHYMHTTFNVYNMPLGGSVAISVCKSAQISIKISQNSGNALSSQTGADQNYIVIAEV